MSWNLNGAMSFSSQCTKNSPTFLFVLKSITCVLTNREKRRKNLFHENDIASLREPTY